MELFFFVVLFFARDPTFGVITGGPLSSLNECRQSITILKEAEPVMVKAEGPGVKITKAECVVFGAMKPF